MNEHFTYILEGALRFLVGDDGAQEIVVAREKCSICRATCRTKPTPPVSSKALSTGYLQATTDATMLLP